MKICLISYEYPPPFEGGQGRHVYELSKSLIRRNNHVEIFSHGQTHFEYNPKDIIHRFSTVNLPLVKILYLSQKISEHLMKEWFDIYHVHVPSLAFFLNKKPIVVTAHTTLFGEGESIQLSQDRSLIDNAISIYYKKLRILDKRVYEKADVIIAVNDNIKTELERVYKINKNKIVTIYNGVNTKFFSPINDKMKLKKEWGLNPESFVILYIGRLETRKNISLLIRATKKLRKDNIITLIGGKGSKEFTLKSLAESLGIVDRVKFLGYVPNNSLAKLYNASDVFVLPSSYEGLPLTLLEAMACGVPTITARFPGVENVIVNNKNGIILDKVTDECLTERIMYLSNHAEFYQEISKNAMCTVNTKFSLENTVEKTIEVYNCL